MHQIGCCTCVLTEIIPIFFPKLCYCSRRTEVRGAVSQFSPLISYQFACSCLKSLSYIEISKSSTPKTKSIKPPRNPSTADDQTSMDSIHDPNCWDFLDNIIDETASPSLLWPSSNSGSVEIDLSSSGVVSQQKEPARKRGSGGDSCNRPGAKACREKLRRERLNDRFQDLTAVLDPGRHVKADKPAILDDTIRLLNQLKSEAQELKETNEKLQEEINCLKAEKNELREEKLTLKADKEKIEQQVKAMAVPPSGFMPAHPAATYHAGAAKMPMYPGYSLIPMWQYLPPTVYDTSRDHELRPPAA